MSSVDILTMKDQLKAIFNEIPVHLMGTARGMGRTTYNVMEQYDEAFDRIANNQLASHDLIFFKRLIALAKSLGNNRNEQLQKFEKHINSLHTVEVTHSLEREMEKARSFVISKEAREALQPNLRDDLLSAETGIRMVKAQIEFVSKKIEDLTREKNRQSSVMYRIKKRFSSTNDSEISSEELNEQLQNLNEQLRNYQVDLAESQVELENTQMRNNRFNRVKNQEELARLKNDYQTGEQTLQDWKVMLNNLSNDIENSYKKLNAHKRKGIIGWIGAGFRGQLFSYVDESKKEANRLEHNTFLLEDRRDSLKRTIRDLESEMENWRNEINRLDVQENTLNERYPNQLAGNLASFSKKLKTFASSGNINSENIKELKNYLQYIKLIQDSIEKRAHLIDPISLQKYNNLLTKLSEKINDIVDNHSNRKNVVVNILACLKLVTSIDNLVHGNETLILATNNAHLQYKAEDFLRDTGGEGSFFRKRPKILREIDKELKNLDSDPIARLNKLKELTSEAIQQIAQGKMPNKHLNSILRLQFELDRMENALNYRPPEPVALPINRISRNLESEMSRVEGHQNDVRNSPNLESRTPSMSVTKLQTNTRRLRELPETPNNNTEPTTDPVHPESTPTPPPRKLS